MILLIIGGLLAFIGIISFILFIVVLIKQFKHQGALHGILGIITCGLYTFIWGWVKSGKLQLSKIMLAWTFLIIISIAAEFLIVFMGIASVQDLPFLDEKTKAMLKSNIESIDKSPIARRPKSRVPGKKVTIPKAAVQGKDPVQNAVALWQGGKYTDPNKALVYLNSAITANPNSAVSFNNRGLAYKDLGQYQKAIADYNQALKLNPNYAQAYNNRGIAYYDTKKHLLAINDYNKSIQLKPDYSNAYLNRGIAYYQVKDIANACKDFHKACELKDCDGIQWALKNNLCK